MNNTDSLCHQCGSVSGVYLQICDNCMTKFNRIAEDNSEQMESCGASSTRAKRCVTHHYGCDCREYRTLKMREALNTIFALVIEQRTDTASPILVEIATICRRGLLE
jgi:hypothetical protein